MGKLFGTIVVILLLISIALSVFALMNKRITEKDVLTKLNTCESIEPQGQGSQNCNEICANNDNKICIKEDVAVYDSTINKWIFDTGAGCSTGYSINNVNGAGGLKLQCLCCNP